MKEAAPPAESSARNPFAPQPQSATPGGATSGMAKLGFAAVLGGYSVEELGFNPTTLPAWITTSVPVSVLNEQISSGNIIVELGMLIDGISDLGFRNTIASAKRDFRIKLPQNEVFHAMTNASAAPAAAPAGASFGNSGQAQNTAARLSVQPLPQQQSPQPMFASAPAAAEPAAQAPTFGAALSAFAQQGQPAAASPLIPAFGPAQNGGTSAPSAFSAPASAPAFGSTAPTGGPGSFAFAPPAEAAPPPPAPAPFAAVQPTAATPSKPLQPLSGVFPAFGAPPPSPAASAHHAPFSGATTKPFDPFAPSSGPLAATKPHSESGFNSAQLLGQSPTAHQQPASIFAPAPEVKPAASLFSAPSPAPFQPTPSFAPALEEIPSFPSTASSASQPASRSLFSAASAAVPLFSEPAPSQPKPEFRPAAQPATLAGSAKMPEVKHSYLGLSPLDTQTDQLLLRALLSTEEKLTAPRVVELLALQQGLSACVCLHGSHVLNHADPSKPEALEFQRQAPDIARQIRGLAPLIGIDGAETFTLNAGGRLITFCFPGSSIVGVLHNVEPSTGMRDKITLIARELDRMLG